MKRTALARSRGTPSTRCSWVIALLLAIPACGRPSPPPSFATTARPGLALAPGLFRLREMDMHLHAGMERRVPLEEWIDIAVAGGRRVVLVLDHL